MASPAGKIESIKANLADELNATEMYRVLSEVETDPKLKQVYSRLSATEQKHAELWAERLREAGGKVSSFRRSWRTRTLGWLARRFGIGAVLPTLTAQEDKASAGYGPQAEGGSLAATERSHARLLRHIGQSTHGGLEGSQLAQMEGRHRSAGGNALRAAVLGADDGLISNFSLVMGVAGALLTNPESSRTILLTGFAGLLAGACSMALGEWISVQSARELAQRQLTTEKEEIEAHPEEEVEELSLIYQARGLEETQARAMASKIISNPGSALETLARDELGIDPRELGGSAWEAAITSFFLFAVGAILPVIPFLFLSGLHAIAGSVLFSAAGLFAIGAAITLFTGKPVVRAGLRQVAFGLAAAAAVFLIGRLLGVSVGG